MDQQQQEPQNLNQREADTYNLRLAVDRLEHAVSNLADKIERTYVRADVYARDQEQVKGDLKGVTSAIEWATRLVIGAVILALLAVVLKSNGGLP